MKKTKKKKTEQNKIIGPINVVSTRFRHMLFAWLRGGDCLPTNNDDDDDDDDDNDDIIIIIIMVYLLFVHEVALQLQNLI